MLAAVTVDEKVITALGTGSVHCIDVATNVPVHWLEVDGKAMLALVTYSFDAAARGRPFHVKGGAVEPDVVASRQCWEGWRRSESLFRRCC